MITVFKLILMTTLCGGILLVCGYMPLKTVNAESGIAVTDTNMWMQSSIKALNKSAQELEKTIETIQSYNSLLSLSPDNMLAKALGINTLLSDFADAYREYNGLINATQNAEQAFTGAFTKIDSLFKGDNKAISSGKSVTINSLDKILLDSVFLGRQATKDIENTFKDLNNTVTDFSSAVGGVQKMQTLGNTAAIETKFARAEVELTTMQTTMRIGRAQYEATESATAIARSKKYLDSFTQYSTWWQNNYNNRRDIFPAWLKTGN